MEYTIGTCNNKSEHDIENGHMKGNRQSRISMFARLNDISIPESPKFTLAELRTPKGPNLVGSNDVGVGVFRGNVYVSDSDGTLTIDSGQQNNSDTPSLIMVSESSIPKESRPSRQFENEFPEVVPLYQSQVVANSAPHESPFVFPPMAVDDLKEEVCRKNPFSEIRDIFLRNHDQIKLQTETSKSPARQEIENKMEGVSETKRQVTLIPLKRISTSPRSDGDEREFGIEFGPNGSLHMTRKLTQTELPMTDYNMIETISKQLTQTVEHGDKIGLTVLNLDQLFSKHENSLGTVLGRAPRILSLISMYGNEKWFRVCCNLQGRTLPWQPMIVLFVWVFFLFLMHTQGLGLVSGFGWKLSSWMYKVLGVSVGFLLKQHATVANERWIEARKVWEDIIDTTRSLVMVLASTTECRKLLREAVSHVVACPICIKNYVMGINNEVWRSELMMVLPQQNCDRLMKCRKRTRATFCLYACQRVVETMIKFQLLSRPVVRDINPRILKLSHFCGDCARIRYTQVPYGYFLHIRLLLLVYLMFLPLLLMGIKGITWNAIILYLLLISYSYAGLESMATEILNPFDRDESDHPLDLYCYLNVSDTRFMVGRGFGERSNFVKAFEKNVIPTLQKWLKLNIPNYIPILQMGRRPKERRKSYFYPKIKKPEPVTQASNIPFDQLNELIYELYSEEKMEKEERARKKRIREHRKQLHAAEEDKLLTYLL